MARELHLWRIKLHVLFPMALFLYLWCKAISEQIHFLHYIISFNFPIKLLLKNIFKRFCKIFTYYKNYFTETASYCIINRIIYYRFSGRAERIHLLNATITATHTRC